MAGVMRSAAQCAFRAWRMPRVVRVCRVSCMALCPVGPTPRSYSLQPPGACRATAVARDTGRHLRTGCPRHARRRDSMYRSIHARATSAPGLTGAGARLRVSSQLASESRTNSWSTSMNEWKSSFLYVLLKSGGLLDVAPRALARQSGQACPAAQLRTAFQHGRVRADVLRGASSG